ncbi:hypothetical protein FOMPIDRAFT_1050063 [Fomitopsis schrenkii]|uniref:Uncharacterized protein n=1 Tax=Fomitopsis schrenkii TaxID=2126942 RepID=S8E9I6_FOMSC|nr:hypothetical protein FOMPIDRAFT_1050063 [Fomitopsis schrenkii]
MPIYPSYVQGLARASSPSKGSEVAVLEYKPDKMRRQLEMIVEAAKSQGGRELIFYEKVLGLTDEEEGVGLPAWCKFDLLDCSHAMRALSAAPHLLADTRHSIICGRSAGWYIGRQGTPPDGDESEGEGALEEVHAQSAAREEAINVIEEEQWEHLAWQHAAQNGSAHCTSSSRTPETTETCRVAPELGCIAMRLLTGQPNCPHARCHQYIRPHQALVPVHSWTVRLCSRIETPDLKTSAVAEQPLSDREVAHAARADLIESKSSAPLPRVVDAFAIATEPAQSCAETPTPPALVQPMELDDTTVAKLAPEQRKRNPVLTSIRPRVRAGTSRNIARSPISDTKCITSTPNDVLHATDDALDPRGVGPHDPTSMVSAPSDSAQSLALDYHDFDCHLHPGSHRDRPSPWPDPRQVPMDARTQTRDRIAELSPVQLATSDDPVQDHPVLPPWLYPPSRALLRGIPDASPPSLTPPDRVFAALATRGRAARLTAHVPHVQVLR